LSDLTDPLQDRIAEGLGRAARKLGIATDAFRPSSADAPLALRNRFLRLHAAFHIGRGFDAPAGYGAPLWQAMLDSAYTKPGDYLVQRGETWFVATQPRLLPVLCVKTNRTVTFLRQAAPDRVGPNAYAGVQRATMQPVLKDWPASVLGLSGSRGTPANLPADLPPTHWTVLQPAFRNTLLRPGDRMQDDLGRAGTITATELSEFGWRLTVREATT